MPFVRSYTTANSTGNATPALPSGWAVDDILLLCCETNSGEAVTAPAGYTEVSVGAQASTGSRLSVFWKRAAGGETAPTITDPGDHIMCSLFAIFGCVTSGDPIRNAAGTVDNVSNTSVAFPSVNGTAGDLICHIMAQGADNASDRLGSFTPDPDLDTSTVFTYSDNTATGGGGGISVCVGRITSTTAANASTATLLTAGTKGLISLALIPDNAYEAANVTRVKLGAVVNEYGVDGATVTRAKLGIVVDLASDSVYVARAKLGIVVDIDPPVANQRRRNFMSFSPS